MVTGVVPSPSPFLPSFLIAHRVQQSHCLSIFHRVLLTHALALSASQFVNKKKSPRIYTSMHSGGFELTKLTYTRFEDNLIHHRGDRPMYCATRDRVPGGISFEDFPSYARNAIFLNATVRSLSYGDVPCYRPWTFQSIYQESRERQTGKVEFPENLYPTILCSVNG